MKLFLAVALLLGPLPVATRARDAAPQPTAARHTRFALTRAFAPQATTPTQTPTPAASPAASPAATPTPDPELEAAQRATKLAEEEKKREVAEKDAAEARNARLKAQILPLGEPKNITVPTGSVTTDAAGWAESQALSNEAARQITQRMSTFLCNNPQSAAGGGAIAIDNVVIYNAADVAGMELYDSIIGQLKTLAGEFDTKHREAVRLLQETDPKVASPAVAGGVDDPTRDTAADGGLLTAFAVPGAATALIKSVAELVNLFRTDTQFVNQSVTISEDAVVSYIADYLSQDSASVTKRPEDKVACTRRFFIYYPLYMPPKPPDGFAGKNCASGAESVNALLATITAKKGAAAADVAAIEKRLEQLTKIAAAFAEKKALEAAKKAKEKEAGEKQKALEAGGISAAQRRKLRDEIAALKLEVKELEGKMAEVPKTLKNLAGNQNLTDDDLKNLSGRLEGWVAKLKDLKTKTELLITTTEQLLTRLNTPDQGAQLTPLARLLRSERLSCIVSSPNTYTLRVSVTANGTTKIKKNLFVDAKVRHSARAGLVYQLFDNLGRVVKGASMQCYMDYQSAQEVRDAVGSTTARCLMGGK